MGPDSNRNARTVKSSAFSPLYLLLFLGVPVFFLIGVALGQTAQAPKTAIAPAKSVTGPACPPATRVDNVNDTYGTTVVTDPYRWLEDQTSPATRAWIKAEDACTDAALGKLPGRE